MLDKNISLWWQVRKASLRILNAYLVLVNKFPDACQSSNLHVPTGIATKRIQKTPIVVEKLTAFEKITVKAKRL